MLTCITCWSKLKTAQPCTSEDQKMKKNIRGMKICLSGGYTLDENELYVKCNLSNLNVRRQVHLRNFILRLKQNGSNMVNNENLNISTRLRDGPVFKVTHPNSEPIKRSVMYAGELERNNLDSELRNIDDIVKFKRVQKSWMLNIFLD